LSQAVPSRGTETAHTRSVFNPGLSQVVPSRRDRFRIPGMVERKNEDIARELMAHYQAMRLG